MPDTDHPKWIKASASTATGNCVEIAHHDDGVLIRDSKRPEAGHLTFTPAEFAAFVDGARNGEFDL